MLKVFLATLDPALTLFVFMAIGFALNKAKILPQNMSKILATLLTWVFMPALSFNAISTYCTLDSLGNNAINLIFGIISVLIAVALSIFLSRFFVKEKCAELGIYRYALAFANLGYFGDPLVLGILGPEALAYYKIFTLPYSITIYTWGIAILVPQGTEKKSVIKQLLNPPTIATFCGIIVGLTGLRNFFPSFISSTVNQLGNCVGPIAMIIGGFTIANYSIPVMLKNKKVYVVTAVRLIALPIIMVSILVGLRAIVSTLLDITINNSVLFLCLIGTAGPLGLNTIVFPEAYGGDPRTGASMATISHTLGVITVPIMYTIAVAIFGVYGA